MGDVVPFRDKRKWTRPEDYGHLPGGGAPEPPRRGRKAKPRWPRLAVLRPWVLLTALVALWVSGSDPALFEPPSWLAGEPEKVNGDFTLCGPGRGHFCVIDGDTFRIGERKIRIIGIDTPETHSPRCPAEAKLGAEATAELQRLLNAGPFTMVARLDEPTDRYGRELRALNRTDAKGETVSLAGQMIASGKARRYAGDLRKGWC